MPLRQADGARLHGTMGSVTSMMHIHAEAGCAWLTAPVGCWYYAQQLLQVGSGVPAGKAVQRLCCEHV